ncbi:MAG: cupin domain-containing protein [Dehalococcoidia bacterium]
MAQVLTWEQLPRFDSTRDGRARIDIINAELMGVDTVRGDIIVYRPGDSAAKHYHADADHFFYVLRGSGRLYVNGQEHALGPGSVVRVEAGEVHWFENPTQEEFSFLELWVPAPQETVWIDENDR